MPLDLLFGSLHYMLLLLENNSAVLKKAAENPNEQIVDALFFDGLTKFLTDLKVKCKEHQFDQCCNHIDRILSKISRQIDYTYLYIHLDDLHAGIRAEGKEQLGLLRSSRPFCPTICGPFPLETSLYCFSQH